MNNLFYGLLFVFLDFDLNLGGMKVGLIPDFIGYILISAGLAELSVGKDRFSRARPFAIAMTVYTAILYGIDLLGISYSFGTLISFILGLASTLMSLYVSYNIVMGVKDLETALEQSLGSRPLYSTWIAFAALSLAIFLFYLIPDSDLIRMIAWDIIGAAFLVLMGKTKNLYYYGGK